MAKQYKIPIKMGILYCCCRLTFRSICAIQYCLTKNPILGHVRQKASKIVHDQNTALQLHREFR